MEIALARIVGSLWLAPPSDREVTSLEQYKACYMNLEIFPMDVQKCTMEVESFGYDMTNLIFEWQKTEPIQLKGSLQLPQFTIKGYRRVFSPTLLMT